MFTTEYTEDTEKIWNNHRGTEAQRSEPKERMD
jgi:hypothetical protein